MCLVLVHVYIIVEDSGVVVSVTGQWFARNTSR